MRIVRRGWRYALPAFLLAGPSILLGWWAAIGLAVFGIAVIAFFRDPDRNPPEEGIVAPADGLVSVVREEDDGRVRVGVFMNVTDVHVNRAPVDGTVTAIEHRSGAHRPAFSKDSDRNERVRIRLGGDRAFVVDLIAGAFARRISPYVAEGEDVERGQRIGHIAFGSRADVLFPAEVTLADVEVNRGDRVRAGETHLVRD